MTVSGIELAYLPKCIPTCVHLHFVLQLFIAYCLCKTPSHIVILFFVYFHWNALIRLTWHTFHFMLQTFTDAVQYGSKNFCNHVEYFGNLLYILCCYL